MKQKDAKKRRATLWITLWKTCSNPAKTRMGIEAIRQAVSLAANPQPYKSMTYAAIGQALENLSRTWAAAYARLAFVNKSSPLPRLVQE